jgi:hypothetical protein
VAVEAKALEIAEPKLHLIASVRFDVIHDTSDGDLTASGTSSAKRLDPQLMARETRPSGSVIEAMPWWMTI